MLTPALHICKGGAVSLSSSRLKKPDHPADEHSEEASYRGEQNYRFQIAAKRGPEERAGGVASRSVVWDAVGRNRGARDRTEAL
jgi:hypothetical protein